MLSRLAVLAMVYLFSAATQAQAASDQETLNIQAEITELESLVISKQSDLDFGNIRHLVTDPGGVGTYGWPTADMRLGTGNKMICDTVGIVATGLQVDQSETPNAAGIHIDGDEYSEVSIQISGILDPLTDPHLILTRSGGVETIRVGSMKMSTGRVEPGGVIGLQLELSTFPDYNFQIAEGLGLCFYGIAELTNSLPAGTYTTTFDVTATYN